MTTARLGIANSLTQVLIEQIIAGNNMERR